MISFERVAVWLRGLTAMGSEKCLHRAAVPTFIGPSLYLSD
jgi:hypothetical protein